MWQICGKNKIGAYYLSNITTSLLTEYRDILANEPSPKPKNGRLTRSSATINRYMATLSVVLSTGVRDWEWLNENPMFKVRKEKEDNSRVRFLTEQEVSTLLEMCKKSSFQLYLFVLIALSTGARYSEILNLKWENVNLKSQLFSFMKTKNGENRGVSITDKLCKILEEYKKGSLRHIKNDFVFSNEKGDAPINRIKAFRNAVKKSGLKDFHFHDLRHTAASYLAMNGKSSTEIAEILGHKTLQMVKRYSHLTKGHTKKVLEDMNNSLFSEVKGF